MERYPRAQGMDGAGAQERGFTVKRELDNLVTQMHAGGITYDEAVREFKRRFVLEVLGGHRGNQCKAAKELGMHRNTLSRILAELDIDPTQVRNGLRRPPRGERPLFDVKDGTR
jgi:Fis family transcriptional regulator, factor for inversion stimulation protein